MWPFGDRPGQQDPVEKYRRWLRKWLMERNHKIPGKYRRWLLNRDIFLGSGIQPHLLLTMFTRQFIFPPGIYILLV